MQFSGRGIAINSRPSICCVPVELCQSTVRRQVSNVIGIIIVACSLLHGSMYLSGSSAAQDPSGGRHSSPVNRRGVDSKPHCSSLHVLLAYLPAVVSLGLCCIMSYH